MAATAEAADHEKEGFVLPRSQSWKWRCLFNWQHLVEFDSGRIQCSTAQVILLKELPGVDETGNWVSCFRQLGLKPWVKEIKKSF